MRGPYLLCVDCGLTATKAVLASSDGEQAAEASVPTEVFTAGETSEIDMHAQWLKAAAAMRDAVRRSGVRPREIVGVGASGHGGGLYPLDARGEPVCRAFTSMDARGQGTVDAWRRDGVSCYALTRHHPWAGQPLPQLRWLRDNRRDLYDGIRWALSAKDWINHNLTGLPGAESTDSSNSGLLNLRTRGYDPGITDCFGVPEAFRMLPPLRGSTEAIGRVCARAARETGLAEGTPVVGGLFDVIAGAVGCGAYGTRAHSVIAGTWNINSSFSGSLVEAPASVKCSLGVDGGLYAYVESSATSAGTLEWFLRKILLSFAGDARGKDLYAAVNEAAGGIDPAESQVLFMPFLHRSHLSRTMDACFLGLRAEHTSAHMLRAVMEGVAFAHRQHLDILASCGLSRPVAVLSGGAANSAVWSRMFADVTGLSIETARAAQAGAMGVAVCAAAGVGVYAGVEEAARAMVRVRERLEPSAGARAAYEEKYSRYREIIELFDNRRIKE
jgi:L-xylulokinase